MTRDVAISLVKEEVNRALLSAPLIVRRYTRHLTASGGKLIRADSLITCAQNGDNLIHENAVKIAAAIEILHLATLVHDDVIDDADVRRGIPTLQKAFGKRTAVVCGDYLLSVALKLAASVPNRKDYLDLELPDYVARICYGELNQHVNNSNFDLSVYRYLKIISGKTAALFEASFYAGAILSGCSGSELPKYRKLGRYVGMIFQLIDDCMDFEATERVALKPVQSDFEQNVVTLPLIHALAGSPAFKEKVKGGGTSRDEVNETVARTGGLGFTRKVAKRYYDKYIQLVEGLDATEQKKEGLVSVLNRAFRVF